MYNYQIIENTIDVTKPDKTIGDVLKSIFIKIPSAILLTLLFAFILIIGIIFIGAVSIAGILLVAIFVVLYLGFIFIFKPFELIQVLFKK